MGCHATFSCCENEVSPFFPFSNEPMRCIYVLCSDVFPPFSSICGKIPFSPSLPLGLAPCSSGKITGGLCLLTRSPAASSCSANSEFGFLSIALSTHSASLVWPHRDFSYCREKICSAKSLIFSMYIMNLLKSYLNFPSYFSEL